MQTIITTERNNTENPNLLLSRLLFIKRNGLIYYYAKNTKVEHVCVSKALANKVFVLAHNRNFYSSFHCTYKQLRRAVFIKRMQKLL